MSTDLRGVFAPIVTPFRPTDGEVDLPWIARHVAYLQAHGCTGVIPCGTNGEAASLSVAERIQVAEAALAAAGDMPVIVGTGAAALPDAIVLTRHAFASGAAGVLVMPPFYFKRPGDASLAAWFRRLFDAGDRPDQADVLIVGETNLMGFAELSNVDKLRKLFEAHRGRLCQCTAISADIRLASLTAENFITLYPLLPYQIDLIISVVSGLRTQGGASHQDQAQAQSHAKKTSHPFGLLARFRV